jgi:hypothetical protein
LCGRRRAHRSPCAVSCVMRHVNWRTTHQLAQRTALGRDDVLQ